MITLIKRAAVSCTLALMLAAPAIAQDAASTRTAQRPRISRGPTPLTNILLTMNLTDEQKQKMNEIREWANGEQTKIRAATGHTTESAMKLSAAERQALQNKLRPQMEKLNKQIREKVDAMLTEEQRMELEEKLRKQSVVGGVMGAARDAATTKAQ